MQKANHRHSIFIGRYYYHYPYCMPALPCLRIGPSPLLRSFEIWMTFYWNNSHMSQRSQSIIQANQSVGGGSVLLALPVSTRRRRHCRFKLNLRVGRGPNAFQLCMLHVVWVKCKNVYWKMESYNIKMALPYHGIRWYEPSTIIIFWKFWMGAPYLSQGFFKLAVYETEGNGVLNNSQ